jgi:transposase
VAMALALQNMGQYIYIKESVSFRDENGKPRNKKVSVGKYDQETETPIFKIEYLVQKKDKGEQILFKGKTYDPNVLIERALKISPKKGMTSPTRMGENHIETIETSQHRSNLSDKVEQHVTNIQDYQILQTLESSKIFGVFYFLVNIATQIDLLQILRKSMPSYYEQIYSLAMYTLKNADAYEKCYDWLYQNLSFDNIGDMRSQNISALLHTINECDRNNFFNLWAEKIEEDEYVNVDITSLPTYSDKICMAEYGHKKQPLTKSVKQVNFCLLFGQKSFTPIYFTLYNGSLHDSKTLSFTVSQFSRIIGNKTLLFVMDRGFFSNKNIATVDQANHKYLCAVPFTNSWSKQLVNTYKDKIDNPSHTIITNDKQKPIFGVHQCMDISQINRDINVHLYFNENSYIEEKNKLYEKIAIITKEIIQKTNEIDQYENFIEQFLIVSKGRGRNPKIHVEPKMDAIQNYLKYTGWFIFASNEIEDPQKAYDIYHNRDMVEKGFFKYKHVLNLDRLEVQSDIRASNKIFMIFICLIIDRYVTSLVKQHTFFKRYSLDRILRIMETIKCSYNNKEELIVGPLTKEQVEIFNFFDIPVPETKSLWDKYNFLK